MIFYMCILKIEVVCELLGFSELMIIYVKEYLRIGIVGGFLFGLFDTIRQYLYVQEIYYVPLYINMITMVICLIMNRFIMGSGIETAAY
jgi:Na+-driven multidrug efflux pump